MQAQEHRSMSDADFRIAEEPLSAPGAGDVFEDCFSERDTDESYAEEWPRENWSFANTEDSLDIAGLDEILDEMHRVTKDVEGCQDQDAATDCSTIDSPGAMSDCSATASNPDVDAWPKESAAEAARMLAKAPPMQIPRASWADIDVDAEDKLTLNLSKAMFPRVVEEKKVNPFRSKLRSKARPFASVTTPPAEVNFLIASAAEALRKSMGIVEVKVRHGGMGGTTLIIGHSRKASPKNTWLFASTKKTLLDLSAQSEKTYILGYDSAQPFQNLDDLSISATIACVPDSHKNSACWDTYSKGFCTRCASGACRWDHPSSSDMMKLIITVTKNVDA